MSLEDFDLEKARELRENAKKPFLTQLRKEFLTTVLATVPLMVLITYAGVRWAQTWIAPDPVESAFYAILYLFGILFICMLWGAYGAHTRLLSILNETKQLRLDLLNSQHEPAEPATGGAESIYAAWPTAAVRPKTIALSMMVLFVLVPLATSLIYSQVERYRRINWGQYETFGGQEALNVHIAADGRARAVSRVSITKSPPLVASIPIRIAQPGATLESVKIGGRGIGFKPVSGDEDVYTIAPGLPENALKNQLIEAVWSWPIEDETVKIHLQGLLPINSYAVNIVMDDGAPYRFEYDDTGAQTAFWTKRPAGRYDARHLGSCRIGLIREAR